MRHVVLVLALIAITSCSDLVYYDRPDGGDCYVDCHGPLPFCGPDRECAECLEDSHCGGETPVCDTATTRTCVSQCSVDSECLNPSAPTCAGHRCVATCSGDSACARFASAPLCDEAHGRCVGCTPESEATDCSGNSCSRTTFTCTSTTRASVPKCGACQADSECFADHACVARLHEGVALGTYCLPIRPMTGCGDTGTNSDLLPYSTPIGATSVDGLATVICSPSDAVSCEAIRLVGTVCVAPEGANPRTNACGSSTLHDGACVALQPGMPKCTYVCFDAVDCKSGGTCTNVAGVTPTVCK